MASMSAVESDEIFSSCSRNAEATPVLGAIQTYAGRQRRVSSNRMKLPSLCEGKAL